MLREEHVTSAAPAADGPRLAHTSIFWRELELAAPFASACRFSFSVERPSSVMASSPRSRTNQARAEAAEYGTPHSRAPSRAHFHTSPTRTYSHTHTMLTQYTSLSFQLYPVTLFVSRFGQEQSAGTSLGRRLLLRIHEHKGLLQRLARVLKPPHR